MATADRPSVGVILVAAGSGTRLGAGLPKALVEVGGRTLLAHCVSRLAGGVDRLVVVAPASHLDIAAEEARRAMGRRQAPSPDAVPASSQPSPVPRAVPHRVPLAVVPGGATRAESVAAGLAALGRNGSSPAVDVVAVHDVARPLVTPEVLARCVRAVTTGADAAAPAVPVTDTLKRVAADGQTVVGTEPRQDLRGVQTPQVFSLATLQAAHAENADPGVTDDLALVEARGGVVRLVEGSQLLMKVTHPLDVVLVEALLAEQGA